MTPIEPRIAVFSYLQPSSLAYKTSDTYHWFASGFEVHHFNNDIEPNILVNNRFSLLIFVGVARRWIKAQSTHLPRIFVDSIDDVNGDMIYQSYTSQSFKDNNPTISAFTPAFNTFKRFDRLYLSLKEQSYNNWEWIILDDSPGDDNFNYMRNIVGNDYRVKIYKSNRWDTLVGSTKRQAASLCNGDYLMEVDHDDELHHLAFELCVSAFKRYPDAGFCYSDAGELFETGGAVDYGDDFGKGEGLHYTQYYKGTYLRPASVPINASTIRHIVGVPNHFRCWRRNLYHELNRHNNKLSIVDDYELIVRTFLKTRIIHIPTALYIQYMHADGNNTQELRRLEIQRLVDRVQKYYDKQIHDRIIELGGIDWQWVDDDQRSFGYIKPPPGLKRSTLAYEYKI